jgi:maleate isomerase
VTDSRQPGSHPTVGVVLPFDSALDHELWQYTPEGVDLYLARTPHRGGPLGLPVIAAASDPELIIPVARDMADALDPDTVVYSCTSGSFIRGLDACMALASDMEAIGCRSAGTTSGFLLEALDHLGATRVALATPYDDTMTSLLVAFLKEAGYEPTSVANLGMTGDPKTVPREEVIRLALDADSQDADVLFLSCTNLRTFDVISELEETLSKPVIASNQITMWGALRLAGIEPPPLDHRLFASA